MQCNVICILAASYFISCMLRRPVVEVAVVITQYAKEDLDTETSKHYGRFNDSSSPCPFHHRGWRSQVIRFHPNTSSSYPGKKYSMIKELNRMVFPINIFPSFTAVGNPFMTIILTAKYKNAVYSATID